MESSGKVDLEAGVESNYVEPMFVDSSEQVARQELSAVLARLQRQAREFKPRDAFAKRFWELSLPAVLLALDGLDPEGLFMGSGPQQKLLEVILRVVGRDEPLPDSSDLDRAQRLVRSTRRLRERLEEHGFLAYRITSLEDRPQAPAQAGAFRWPGSARPCAETAGLMLFAHE